jgi:hypothetical protein
MPFLTVQISGAPLIKLEVDTAEVSGSPPGQLIAKKGGKQVGEWNVAQLVGWWLKDHEDDAK